MATDPSWLYSTIAQSSAAIVAIIGGFITATVLMLTSEKRSLSHQKTEKETQLTVLEKEHDMETIGNIHYNSTKLDRIKDLERRISILKSDVTNLDVRLRTFSYPPNLEWGLAVLGYLAIFGIWLPVIVIAGEYFSIYTKLLAASTFLLGIIVVFAYIVFQIRALRRK